MASFKRVHLKLTIILLAFMICSGFYYVPVNGKRYPIKCYFCGELRDDCKSENNGTTDFDDRTADCKSTELCTLITDEEGKVIRRNCATKAAMESFGSEGICMCNSNLCNGGKTCKADPKDSLECYSCTTRGPNKQSSCSMDYVSKFYRERCSPCVLVTAQKTAGNEEVKYRGCIDEEEELIDGFGSESKICKCTSKLCNNGDTCKAEAAEKKGNSKDTGNSMDSGNSMKTGSSVGSLDSFGLFWITGLLLIGYSLSSVIGNAPGSGRQFSSY